MGIENNKWFAMGLIGIITAIGGVITLFFSMFGIRHMSRMVNNFTIATIILIYAISQLGNGTWAFMLVTQYSALIRYQRRLLAFRLSLLAGICVCIIGGILAIIGWIKYFQLEHEGK